MCAIYPAQESVSEILDAAGEKWDFLQVESWKWRVNNSQLIPASYKQTEVGVIPEDWEVKQIGDLEPFVTSGSRGWAAFYSEHGSPFIRITNLSRTCIYPDLEDLRFVNLAGNDSEAARTQLHDGDVLISITADIGIVGHVTEKLPKPAYINQHIALVRFDSARTNSRFVSYFLASENPQKLFRALTDSGAKAGMNLTTVQQIRIALPPTIAEQEAIAETLSDADALIESLEQLLGKKRQIKQGAMQELLTGKKRLPGFSGEWEVKRLGLLGSFLKGSGVTKAEAQSGNLACVRYGEIYTRHNDYIKAFHSWISPEVAVTATRLKHGDILFAGSGETKEEIGKCAAFVSNLEAYAGGDIVILRPEQGDSLFLGYYLNTQPINRQKASKGQGDAVVHISSSALMNVHVTVPTVPEQTAIAAILSDMDAEIAALEQRRDKSRAIKQGMMQQLLTGRVRLVSDQEDNDQAS